MQNVNISIILLNYNTLFYTEQCIQSIIQNTNIDYEIIVVENGSNDKENIKIIENKYKCVKVIISEKNLGFGAGNNLGVENANGKYVVILNNDTIVFPATIDRIFEILEKCDFKDIITGFIEDGNGKLQYSGGEELKILRELLRFGFLLIKYVPFKYYENHYFIPKKDEKTRIIDWATGCFFALTKDFYKELNGFDENMFMYVEDVEFHKRIRLNGGKILFRPEIRIRHFGSQTSKDHIDTVLKSQYKNTLYYFKKHKGIILAAVFYLISKTIFFIWYLFFSLLDLFFTFKLKISKKKRLYKLLLFK